MLRKFFLKGYSNPIYAAYSRTKYSLIHRYSVRALFIKKLNKEIPGWVLCKVNALDGSKIYALTHYHGPMYVGDDIGINDPIVPLDDIANAFYGFSFGVGVEDLPQNPVELAILKKKVLSAYEFVKNKEAGTCCPECEIKPYSWGSGRTKDNHLCPTCFGLERLYTYGPQSVLGQRLLAGSKVTLGNNSDLHFKVDGLSALFELYERYHAGRTHDLVMHITEHPQVVAQIIAETFPEVTIYVTYDHKEESGLGDYAHDENGKILNRHFYLPQDDHYINLHTGKIEEPSYQPSLATIPDELPNAFRWNVNLDILKNLCKLAQ